MKSSELGKSISEIEVTNISSHGIWLYANGAEHFLPYDEYPWFMEKTVSQITNVEGVPKTGHNECSTLTSKYISQ